MLFGRQQDVFKFSWAPLGGGLLSTALSQGCAVFTSAALWLACLLSHEMSDGFMASGALPLTG